MSFSQAKEKIKESPIKDKKLDSKDFVHIVLDIDETLVSSANYVALHSHSVDSNKIKVLMAWFKERDFVIEAQDPYLVHPGAIEFIRYIFQIPNVRVSFFSAGLEARNMLVVEKILIRALGKEEII